jgi:hypothetical protein
VENQLEDNPALLTPKGTFIELVKAISINQLPTKALAYFKRNRANVKIMEAGLVTDASGTVTYKPEMGYEKNSV